MDAAWVSCACGDYWCTVHEQHAHDCACPAVDEWPTDPYSDPTPHPDANPASSAASLPIQE